jgi:hypothetical protein
MTLSNTVIRNADHPLPQLYSALALGADVVATIATRVALRTAIFAGRHVVDETPNIATEIFAHKQGLVITAHIIDHFVDIFTGRTTPKLLAGKLASAVQIKVHPRLFTCAICGKVDANEVGDVGELLGLARDPVAVLIRKGEHT